MATFWGTYYMTDTGQSKHIILFCSYINPLRYSCHHHFTKWENKIQRSQLSKSVSIESGRSKIQTQILLSPEVSVWGIDTYPAAAAAAAKSLQSRLTLCNPLDYSPPGSSVHHDSPGKNTGVGCYALLQGTFPTQGSNCVFYVSCIARWILHGEGPSMLG